MIFNGHTAGSVEDLDEDIFADICVMFSDGLLGGKGRFDSLAPLTAAVFNYMRPAHTPACKTEDIFPWVNEYEKNPDLEVPETDKINSNLLAFLTQAPGFSMERINGN